MVTKMWMDSQIYTYNSNIYYISGDNLKYTQLQKIGAVMPSTSPCEGEDLHGDGRWMAMVSRFEIFVFVIVIIVMIMFITVILIITSVSLSLWLPSIFSTKWRLDMITKSVNMIPHCSSHGHVLHVLNAASFSSPSPLIFKERKKDGIKAKVGTRSSWRQIDCMS